MRDSRCDTQPAARRDPAPAYIYADRAPGCFCRSNNGNSCMRKRSVPAVDRAGLHACRNGTGTRIALRRARAASWWSRITYSPGSLTAAGYAVASSGSMNHPSFGRGFSDAIPESRLQWCRTDDQAIEPRLVVDFLNAPARFSQPTSSWRQSSTVNLDVHFGQLRRRNSSVFSKSYYARHTYMMKTKGLLVTIAVGQLR